MSAREIGKTIYLEWRLADTAIGITLACAVTSALLSGAGLLAAVFIAAQFMAIISLISCCCQDNIYGGNASFYAMFSQDTENMVMGKILFCAFAMASLFAFSLPLQGLFQSNFDLVIDLEMSVFDKIPAESCFPAIALFELKRIAFCFAVSAAIVAWNAYFVKYAKLQNAIIVIAMWLPFLGLKLSEKINLPSISFGMNMGPCVRFVIWTLIYAGLTVIFYMAAVRSFKKNGVYSEGN